VGANQTVDGVDQSQDQPGGPWALTETIDGLFAETGTGPPEATPDEEVFGKSSGKTASFSRYKQWEANQAHRSRQRSVNVSADRIETDTLAADTSARHRAAPSLTAVEKTTTGEESFHKALAKRAEAAAKFPLEAEHRKVSATLWRDAAKMIEAKRAAKSFDERQRALKHGSHQAIKLTSSNPADIPASRAFRTNCRELFRNRYFVPEKAAQAPTKITGKKREIQKEGWRLESSIWAGRQFRGFDSMGRPQDRGFYDGDEIVRRAIQCDFRKAIDKGLLADFLLKHDKDAPDPESQPDETEMFMADVEDVFADHGRLFFMVFDFFATQSGNDDLFHIHKNGFYKMVEQCGMVVKGSKHSDRAHMDIIFKLVNASELGGGKKRRSSAKPALKRQLTTGKSPTAPMREKLLSKIVKHDSEHCLTRAELIQCLCRIAVARYILTPKTAKTPKAGKACVSDAIDELMKTIRHQASREVQQDGQLFRRMSCYIEETDAALRMHEAALRLLFAKYSSGEGVDGKGGAGAQEMKRGNSLVAESDNLLSPGEWVCFCRELALIGDDLSMQDARLIFQWSRMRVVDEDDATKRQRIENLTFWGFLEAMVRVAQSKALPTDEEVSERGYKDGGDFLIRMRKDHPSEYRAFVVKNNRQWYEQTRQPIAKKLSILLLLIMRTLSANLRKWEASGQMDVARKKAEKAKASAARTQAAVDLYQKEQKEQEMQAQQQQPSGDLLDGVGEGSLSVDSLMKLGSALDQQSDILGSSATTVQRFARGYIARTKTVKELKASLTIQAHTRGLVVRNELMSTHKASQAIQKHFRRFAVQNGFKQLESAQTINWWPTLRPVKNKESTRKMGSIKK
jgi:hypothetical protein